jgi:radical SAM protein with 4Fe4S-binding SPASM domain
MGDPLVHPQLFDLIEICHSYAVRIFFVTNGYLLREKQSNFLLHPAFRQVNFSLHSFFDNFPDLDPTQYLERIFDYTERAFELRPDLYINYRLWNLSETRKINSNNQDILRRIEQRFGIKINTNINIRIQKSRRLKNRLYMHFDSEFIWPGLDLPILGDSGRCHGLSAHFGILIDGTVVPCCLDKEGSIPLGNARDRPISEILDNSRSQAILKGFQEKRLVEDLCQRCKYIERFKKK